METFLRYGFGLLFANIVVMKAREKLSWLVAIFYPSRKDINFLIKIYQPILHTLESIRKLVFNSANYFFLNVVSYINVSVNPNKLSKLIFMLTVVYPHAIIPEIHTYITMRCVTQIWYPMFS